MKWGLVSPPAPTVSRPSEGAWVRRRLPPSSGLGKRAEPRLRRLSRLPDRTRRPRRFASGKPRRVRRETLTIRHRRAGYSACAGSPCRAGKDEARAQSSPSVTAPSSRPSLALASRLPKDALCPGPDWLDSRPCVAARSVVPPGFCRGCRSSRRPGFHLAAAVRGGFVSRPRLARSAPGGLSLRLCPETSVRFRPGRPWPHRQAVTDSDSRKGQCACG